MTATQELRQQTDDMMTTAGAEAFRDDSSRLILPGASSGAREAGDPLTWGAAETRKTVRPVLPGDCS